MKKSFLVLLLFLFNIAQGFCQCAMCRASVGSNLSDGRGQVIGTGINYGILYMLLFPYILVGSLIFFWFRYGKKELKEKQELEERLKEVYKK